MIQLGALLLGVAVEQDPIATYRSCTEGCRLCMEACPTSALAGTTVDQQLCRPVSNFRNDRGFVLKKCWECHRICPNHAGIPDSR